MQLELLKTLELGKIGHEWHCPAVPQWERFKSVPNTKLNMDGATEKILLWCTHFLLDSQKSPRPVQQLLTQTVLVLPFLVFSCNCQFPFAEPWLLSSLSKVTSKRTCQHSLSVWHECQRTARGCQWGTRFLVTAGMSDCYMHFKSLQKIRWLESKSQSLLCL